MTPLLALVRELVSRGDDLVVYSTPFFATNIEQTVASFVPQLEVLQRASAFVTHSGMNSVSESLRMSVPMVTVPQMGEQEIVSRRVEQLRAGLYLAKDEVSPDRLRLSVRRLLKEERFRKVAAGLGETLLAAGGIAEAATLVKAFAAVVARRES